MMYYKNLWVSTHMMTNGGVIGFFSGGAGGLQANPHTVCGGAVVQPAEGAAAPHEGSSAERGGVQGGEAPTAAEAHARWSRPGRLSGHLLAIAAGVAAVSVEAAAPSMSVTSSAVACLFSSTERRSC